jgi:hypothetical protein
MKIIDKTPYLNKNGTIGPLGQIQGTFSLGTNWYSDMKGQEAVIAALEKHLDNKYVLIRNPILPGSQDVRLPLVLSGPTGVFLLYVTSARGMFRAKGDEWGTISGDHFKPLRPNLVLLTARFSQGLQKFLERQGIMNMLTVEPILLSANPGMHVDTVRPLVRVVMSDALERFAVSINQARALQSAEDAQLIIDRIITPKAITKQAPAAVVPAEQRQTPMYDPNDRFAEENQAAAGGSGNDPFAFSYGDEARPEAAPVVQGSAAPEAQPAPQPMPKPVKKKPVQSNIKISNRQIAIIVGVFAVLVVCLMVLIGVGLYMNVR